MSNNGRNYEAIVVIRERGFYDVFSDFTLMYARIFPRPLRTIIEFLFLLMAFLWFFILIYAHIHFSQMQANCLDHVKDIWPRDGILRVEIIRSFQRSHAIQTGTINELFTVEKSYEREYKLKKYMGTSEGNSPENKKEVDIEPSTEELVENKFRETNTPKPTLFNYLSFTNYINFEDEKKEMFSSTTKTNRHTTSKSNFSIVEDSAQFHSTKCPNSSIRGVLGIDSLQSTSTKLPSIDDNEVILYKNYIVEYSLEYGFLLLSPNARNRLGIPVMLVALEPTRNKCFGNSVDQFFLEHFFGYDDLLKSSVMSLSENEQNKGDMRNVIVEKNYRFYSTWTARTSYITSFFVMIMFTLSISIISRYSHHQLIILIVDWQQFVDFHGALSLPVAPILAVILSLLCMEEIISEFFNCDFVMGVNIILIALFADIYDTACSHCPITKRHWPKFFYLYYFSFYAYLYRFDGQFGDLALLCSWCFILHSMVYFYHRYELPLVLRQQQQQQQQQQQHQQQHQPIGAGSVRPEGRRPIRGDHQAGPAFQPDI